MGLNYRALVSADTQILQVLASAPYADCRELMALSGRHSRLVDESVERLHTHRLIRFVWYANGPDWWVRRWFVTGWGVLYLSMLDGSDLESVVANNPVSFWWQRNLVGKLDAVRSAYRVVQDAAVGAESGVGWRWYREGLFEGVMTVGDERQFGLVLGGRTATGDELAGLVRRIGYRQRERNYPDVLMLVPGELEAQMVVADTRAEFARVHVASDEALMRSRYSKPVWRRYGADAATLTEVMEHRGASGKLDADFSYGSADDILASEMPRLMLAPDLLVWSELSAVARQVLRLLYDWPLINLSHLSRMAGIGNDEAQAGVEALMDMGLVESVRTGSKRRTQRYALSVVGLTKLASQEGTDDKRLIKSWAVGQDAGGRPASGRRGRMMAGTDIRYAFNNLGRIDRVHQMLAMLKGEFLRHDNWQMAQALPWHRWNRRLKGSGRTFAPYATIQVAYRRRAHHFFVEVDESRSITPRLQKRIGDYHAYLRADVARSDFDGEGAGMLVVLADGDAVRRFCDVTTRKFRQVIPLFATSLDALMAEGPLGRVWRSPWTQHIRSMSFEEVCYGVRFRTRTPIAPQR